jgi:hypothetical protein
MSIRKPFVTGMSIQVSAAMIAAMGGNPATKLAESLRSLASQVGPEEIDKIGELFRYRAVDGEIVIDLSVDASKDFFDFFNSLLMPALGSVGTMIEMSKTRSVNGHSDKHLLTNMLVGLRKDFAHKMAAGRMPEGNMLPTMPAPLTAH